MTEGKCVTLTASPTALGLPLDYLAALQRREPRGLRALYARLRYGKTAHGFAWCMTHQAVVCRDYRGRLVHHEESP